MAEGEDAGDGFEEGFLGVAVEVFDGAVVREDLELAGGEEDGEEPVVVLAAGVGGVCLAALPSDAAGAGRAVVAVGDVGDGDVAEVFDEGLSAGDPPDGVLDAVGRGEVVERRGIQCGGGEGVDGLGVAVGEEDGAGVGT